MLTCPYGAKRLAELLVVLDSGLTNRTNLVAQPGCADLIQSLIEELLPKLLRQGCKLLDH